MSIGTRLNARRTELGWSQAKLAAASGMSQQMISKLEKGKAESTGDLVALSKAMGVTEEWLQHGSGQKLRAYTPPPGDAVNFDTPPAPDINSPNHLSSGVTTSWKDADSDPPGNAVAASASEASDTTTQMISVALSGEELEWLRLYHELPQKTREAIKTIIGTSQTRENDR